MSTSHAGRYIVNDATTLLSLTDPRNLLVNNLESIVTNNPPSNSGRQGFFAGPTSIAYLLFHLSFTHTDLCIRGRSPKQWLETYLDLPAPEPQPDVPLLERHGTMNESLCWLALRAVSLSDPAILKEFLTAAARISTEGHTELHELLLGGAGALFILRFVRTFCMDHEARITALMEPIITNLLARRPWTLLGKRYIGAAHGDIGIITQIVLCDPVYASELENDLSELLDLQLEDGNWPSTIGGAADLVQWCHGAPGFVVALEAIRAYFPALDTRVEAAVVKARKCVWERGLLIKEPNLCHGITGNALALTGRQRDHFLALTTPERMKDVEWDASKDPWCLYKGEAGRAWVWAQLDGGSKGFPAFTDI